jgi:hypothetical protein
VVRRECNRLVTTRPRSCRYQFAGFCGAELAHPPPQYPKSPRSPLCPSSPRGETTTSVVLAVGSVSQTGLRQPARRNSDDSGPETRSEHGGLGQLENALFSVRCPCAASPACLVLLWAPETVPRVHLKASRTALRDEPANADTFISRQFRICSSCTASRLEGGLTRAHFTETPTGFFCSKMVLNKETRIIPFARRPHFFSCQH